MFVSADLDLIVTILFRQAYTNEIQKVTSEMQSRKHNTTVQNNCGKLTELDWFAPLAAVGLFFHSA